MKSVSEQHCGIVGYYFGHASLKEEGKPITARWILRSARMLQLLFQPSSALPALQKHCTPLNVHRVYYFSLPQTGL